MNKKLSNFLRAGVFALFGTFGLLSVSADAQFIMLAQATDNCLAPVEAQQATLGGNLIPLQQIYAQRGFNPGDVLDRQVCRDNGELYYVLTVYQNGAANKVWINARTGQ